MGSYLEILSRRGGPACPPFYRKRRGAGRRADTQARPYRGQQKMPSQGRSWFSPVMVALSSLGVK